MSFVITITRTFEKKLNNFWVITIRVTEGLLRQSIPERDYEAI